MKKFTERFLKKEVSGDSNYENVIKNAKKAFKKFGLPEKLWIELTEKSFNSPKLISILNQHSKTVDMFPTAFMVGVIVGWVEKSRKIK